MREHEWFSDGNSLAYRYCERCGVRRGSAEDTPAGCPGTRREQEERLAVSLRTEMEGRYPFLRSICDAAVDMEAAGDELSPELVHALRRYHLHLKTEEKPG